MSVRAVGHVAPCAVTRPALQAARSPRGARTVRGAVTMTCPPTVRVGSAARVGSRVVASSFSSPSSACLGRYGSRGSRVLTGAAVDMDGAKKPSVTAEEVVRGMYDAINRRDVAAALEFVDDDILYEDFNFPAPFKGKAAVKKLFEESCDGIPDDMLFIVDECTDGGGVGVGMTWYVELEGEAFPNARGASFYRINPETGKLVYARDVVESPMKLGDISFSIIRAVAPLVKEQLKAQKEQRLATEGTGAGTKVASTTEATATESSGNAVASAGLYALGAVYWFVLLLSPPGWQGLPGEPAWAIAPETLTEVIAESTDFFFVLPLLNKFGFDLLGAAPQVHPVTLGVFNFAEAFVFMLLPPLLMDRKGRDLPTVKVWSFAMFLTNALLLPYMVRQPAQPTQDPTESPPANFANIPSAHIPSPATRWASHERARPVTVPCEVVLRGSLSAGEADCNPGADVLGDGQGGGDRRPCRADQRQEGPAVQSVWRLRPRHRVAFGGLGALC